MATKRKTKEVCWQQRSKKWKRRFTHWYVLIGGHRTCCAIGEASNVVELTRKKNQRRWRATIFEWVEYPGTGQIDKNFGVIKKKQVVRGIYALVDKKDYDGLFRDDLCRDGYEQMHLAQSAGSLLNPSRRVNPESQMA